MTIEKHDLEPRFKFEVAARPEAVYINRCYACGGCTGICPVNQVIPDFDPRKILHMTNLGLKKRLLSSELIWHCTRCKTCEFICPQDVRFSDVVKALRSIAVRDGYIDAKSLGEIGKLAVVDRSRCVGCLTCVRVCPFEASSMEGGQGVAHIEAGKCAACGICVAECPVKAIELKESEDVRRLASWEPPDKAERFDETFQPDIKAFCCYYTAIACSQDLQNPCMSLFSTNVHVEIVPCSGRISVSRLLKAFEDGADGVYILGCLEDACHNKKGSQVALNRVQYVKGVLDKLNIESSRIKMYTAARESNRGFIDAAKDMTKHIKKLGPSLLKKYSAPFCQDNGREIAKGSVSL